MIFNHVLYQLSYLGAANPVKRAGSNERRVIEAHPTPVQNVRP